MHAGDEDDFVGLAGGFEAFGEGLDGRVEADGSECGHVEDGAYGGASGEDGAFAVEAAGVTADGGDADEGADAAFVDLSQFWKLGDERGGDGFADAGDAGEEVAFAGEVVVGVDELVDLLVEGLDLSLQVADDLFECVADAVGGSKGQLIAVAVRASMSWRRQTSSALSSA